jgi:hypothetical protein
MYKCKNQEHPHKDMVYLPGQQVSSQEWHHPREKFREPGITHCGIHTQSCDALQYKYQESNEISKTGEQIMPYGVHFHTCDLQNIYLNYPKYLFPLFPFIRNKVFPVGVFISHKSPVNPDKKIEEKDICEQEMDEAYSAEPVAERCFSLECILGSRVMIDTGTAPLILSVFTNLQHILGNCSPDIMSTILLLPISVLSFTIPLSFSVTLPMMVLSFP